MFEMSIDPACFDCLLIGFTFGVIVNLAVLLILLIRMEAKYEKVKPFVMADNVTSPCSGTCDGCNGHG